ncbi:MAG: hypothetical protein JRD89_02485 [Deltaproteobacteria bacterium]|nr:hypothetical protein [Deltaproteobacteria bacterium]
MGTEDGYQWWAERDSSRTQAHVGVLYFGNRPAHLFAGPLTGEATVATICDCALQVVLSPPKGLGEGYARSGYGPPRTGVLVCPSCLAKLSMVCADKTPLGKTARRLLYELGWGGEDPPHIWRVRKTRLLPADDIAGSLAVAPPPIDDRQPSGS